MKLQIRTLSVQERKELYTQALAYFDKPREERERTYYGNKASGVCEFLAGVFYKPLVFKGMTMLEIDSILVYAKGIPRIADLGKELMPELWHRKTKEGTEESPYWFNNDEERLIALEDCLYDTVFLMEEDDEQSTKVLYEFVYNVA